MKFEEALAAMRDGATVARPSWRSFRGSYGIRFNAGQSEIVKAPSAGAESTWSPTGGDVVATDWSVAA